MIPSLQTKTGERVVQIIVKSGCVVDVVNLPDTCVYEVIDRDENKANPAGLKSGGK